MERLTFLNGDEVPCVSDDKCYDEQSGHYCGPAIDRLAAYEGTGLTPEQVSAAKTIIGAILTGDTGKVKRIRELAEADKEGRVVVLPCKIGNVLFRPLSWRNIVEKCTVSLLTQKADKSWKIRLTSENFRTTFEITINDIGKTVFLTSEDAEKELEAMNDG